MENPFLVPAPPSSDAPETSPFLVPAPVVQEQGLYDRSVDRLDQGFSDAGAQFPPAPSANPLGSLSTSLRKSLGGDIIPAVGDVLTDTVMTAGKEVLPLSMQRNIAEGAEYVKNTPPVRMLTNALGAAEKEFPEAYETVGDMLNIAGGVSSLLPRAKALTPKTDLASNAKQAKTDADTRRRAKDVGVLLEPIDPINARGKTVEKGMLRSRVYEPTTVEKRMYDEVNAVKGVDPERSALFNRNALETEVDTLRKGLDSSLEGKASINKTAIDTDIAAVIEDIKLQPTLVGDAGKAAERIYTKFDQLVTAKLSTTGDITAGELLQVRRDLDNWLRDSGTTFDNTANARGIAVKNLRTAINKRVSEAVPDAKVTESLSKQADLLTARDILNDKALREGSNSLTRSVQKIEETTGIHAPSTPLGQVQTSRSIPAALGTAAVTGTVLGGRRLADALRSGGVTSAKVTDNIISNADRLTVLGNVLNTPDEEQ